MNMKETFGLNLPEQVPYFGFDEPYFFGNGITGSGGLRNGTWDYCMGYAYGDAYNMIKRERMKVYVDGRPCLLNGDMHRARHTGVFYSVNEFKKATVALVDFSPRDTAYTARLIAVCNTSDQPIQVHPYAEVKYANNDHRPPEPGANNYVDVIEEDGIFHLYKTCLEGRRPNWLSLSYGGCKTVVEHHNEFLCAEVLLISEDITLAPGEVKYFTLYHEARLSDEPIEKQTYTRFTEDGSAALEACISEWIDWSSQGLDTSFIPDEKSREILEGGAIIMRMLQAVDGGVMATPRVYIACYVRDAYCAMRGMLALERYDMVKDYLKFQHDVYHFRRGRGEFGVPCASEMGGGDSAFFGFGDEENWSCESPGLCVVLAGDYYCATGDLEFLKSMDEFMRYCIDVQIAHAKKNGWRLYFNNDETESQGWGALLRELVCCYDENWYSLTSSSMCAVSIRYMLDYLKEIGQADTAAYADYQAALENVIAAAEETFWNEELGIYQWFRKADGTWPKTLVPDFQITPLYLGAPFNPQRIEASAKKMVEYWDPETGFIPNQVFSVNEDFCGHNLGYLLYMASVYQLPEVDGIYEGLIKTLSAYGMWCEAYYEDGTPYQGPTTSDNRMHNFRCFESGTNLEAIVAYWKAKQN